MSVIRLVKARGSTCCFLKTIEFKSEFGTRIMKFKILAMK